MLDIVFGYCVASKGWRLVSALQNKYRLLQDLLRSYGKVAIAYSGGVDSSLLSYVAHETLGIMRFPLPPMRR